MDNSETRRATAAGALPNRHSCSADWTAPPLPQRNTWTVQFIDVKHVPDDLGV